MFEKNQSSNSANAFWSSQSYENLKRLLYGFHKNTQKNPTTQDIQTFHLCHLWREMLKWNIKKKNKIGLLKSIVWEKKKNEYPKNQY